MKVGFIFLAFEITSRSSLNALESTFVEILGEGINLCIKQCTSRPMTVKINISIDQGHLYYQLQQQTRSLSL